MRGSPVGTTCIWVEGAAGAGLQKEEKKLAPEKMREASHDTESPTEQLLQKGAGQRQKTEPRRTPVDIKWWVATCPTVGTHKNTYQLASVGRGDEPCQLVPACLPVLPATANCGTAAAAPHHADQASASQAYNTA